MIVADISTLFSVIGIDPSGTDSEREKKLIRVQTPLQTNQLYNSIHLSDFKEHEKIYLRDTTSYSVESLHQQFYGNIKSEIKNGLKSYRGFFSKVSPSGNTLEFCQYHFPFQKFTENEQWKLRTVMLFHEKFAESFIEKASLKFYIKIDNEKYFWYYNKESAPVLKVSFNTEKLKVKVPNIVKIVCKEIEPLLTQDSFSNEVHT